MPVSKLYELLPVQFLSFEASLSLESVSPYFIMGWSKETSSLQEEELVLIPPGIRAANFRHPASCYHWISFHSPALQEHRLIGELKEPFSALLCPYVKGVLSTIAEHARQEAAHRRQIGMSNALFALMAEMVSQLEALSFSMDFADSPELPLRPISGDGRSVIYATRYIRRNMANPDLSLGDIAQAIGYNSNYFCHKFSCMLHVSPIRFLRNVRLERTLELLKETDYSIQTICRLVGIRSPSSIAGLVKAHSGLTPVEYRMRNAREKINC